MLSDYFNSIIRTLAGYAIAWLLSLKLAGPVLALFGVDSATAKERLTAAAVVVAGTAWYAIVRAIEQRWPGATVLLGSTKQPVAYTAAQPVPAVAQPAVPADALLPGDLAVTDIPASDPPASVTLHSDFGFRAVSAWVTPGQTRTPQLMEMVDGGWQVPDPAPNPVWAAEAVTVDESTITSS